ncbi:MAG: hypothetical protein AAB274_04305 [Nitrospirota bacterium]
MSRRTFARFTGAVSYVWELQERERKRILAEAVQVKGLMPLLMKPRNKQRWTREDRAELRAHVRRLSDLSPYLVLVVLPGAPLTLPLLAWWLDRRRQHRKGGPPSAVPADPA